MTIKEMQNFLQEISDDRFQTKILNAILSCFDLSKMNEERIQKLEEKVNELIDVYNKENEQDSAQEENAEALNYVIEEDSQESDFKDASWEPFSEEDITTEMENDALVEESPHGTDILK